MGDAEGSFSSRWTPVRENCRQYRATAKVPDVTRPPRYPLQAATRAASLSGFRAAAEAEAAVCTRHPLPSRALRWQARVCRVGHSICDKHTQGRQGGGGAQIGDLRTRGA